MFFHARVTSLILKFHPFHDKYNTEAQKLVHYVNIFILLSSQNAVNKK
jgi:hypothetical protein